MLPWFRRRLAADDGISLVEMLAAMAVLAVALSAMASTLISSLLAVAGNERQSHATQLGNELLEELHALPWDSVGFYEDDSPSTAEGPPVFVGAVRPASEQPLAGPAGCAYGSAADPGAAPLTEESFFRAGVCYDVQRAIVWRNDGDGDYKMFVVTVTWNTGTRERSLRTAAARAPSPGDEVRVFTAELAVDANVVTYDATGTSATPSSITFTATTNDPADFPVSLTWDDGGTPVPVAPSMTSPDGGRTWTTTVSTTADPWDPGDVTFTFTATRGALTAEASTTVTFKHEGAPPVVEVRSLTLSQPGPPAKTPICVKTGSNAGKPDPNLLIDVDVRGLGSTDNGRVTVTWTNQNVPLVANYLQANAAGDGAVFRLTVDNNFIFSTSSVDFQVHVDGTLARSFGPYTTKTGGGC